MPGDRRPRGAPRNFQLEEFLQAHPALDIKNMPDPWQRWRERLLALLGEQKLNDIEIEVVGRVLSPIERDVRHQRAVVGAELARLTDLDRAGFLFPANDCVHPNNRAYFLEVREAYVILLSLEHLPELTADVVGRIFRRAYPRMPSADGRNSNPHPPGIYLSVEGPVASKIVIDWREEPFLLGGDAMYCHLEGESPIRLVASVRTKRGRSRLLTERTAEAPCPSCWPGRFESKRWRWDRRSRTLRARCAPRCSDARCRPPVLTPMPTLTSETVAKATSAERLRSSKRRAGFRSQGRPREPAWYKTDPGARRLLTAMASSRGVAEAELVERWNDYVGWPKLPSGSPGVALVKRLRTTAGRSS